MGCQTLELSEMTTIGAEAMMQMDGIGCLTVLDVTGEEDMRRVAFDVEGGLQIPAMGDAEDIRERQTPGYDSVWAIAGSIFAAG